MRKLLTLIALASIIFSVASPANAAVALVSGQTTSSSASYGSTALVLTLPNNPATNNLVVITVTLGTGATSYTVVDSNSNSYTATPSTPFAGSGSVIGIYYLIAPSNATKTITITKVGGTPAGLILGFASEYSGTATSSVLERDATQSFGGPSTAITTPSLTSTNNGDLLVGHVDAYGTVTSANSPWTGIGSVQNLGNYSEYYVQATAGAQGINFTQSTSTEWDSISAAFKAGAGGGGGTLRSMTGVGR
jgi:hypothetical protein